MLRIKGKILSTLTVVFLFVSSFLSAAESDFPVPENLKPAINFWVSVYTEVDTESGFLHDPRDLSVVYARLERDSVLIDNTRKQIREDLRVLATGKRTGLTREQARILSLWPAGVSNARLEQAADEVRWQLGQSDRFVAGLKRSGAYRRHIEDVILSKGLPLELAILPHVESSFHPGAYSSANATGMWQFVRSTAQRFMQVDYVVDQRLDPYDATYAAMDLLQYNYNALGTWPLALTAYNHGANGMARAVDAVGSTDIGRIVSEYSGSRFGFASRNFYAQFLAVLELERNEQAYFGEVVKDSPPEFVSMALDAYVDAITLAQALGTDMTSLRRNNPALQPSVWSGTKRIPKGYVLKMNRAEYPGDINAALALISPELLFSSQIPDKSYTVRSGDSLSVIAGRYQISVSELVAINQLRDRNRIRIGQVLLLPQPEGAATALAAASANPWQMPEDGLYEVMQGDTLSIIATRFQVSEENLLGLNTITDKNLILPGQTLRLKGDAALPGSVAVVDEILPESEESAPAVPETTREELLAVLDEPVIRDELSQDTNSPALEVSEQALAAEEVEQLRSDLSSDPADYTVHSDSTIEIQAEETLGHYAEWLGIRASDLRQLNNLRYQDPVIIGQRLTLSFDEVSREDFERSRQAYHRDLQQSYFSSWHIKGTEQYTIRNRDVVSRLADNRDVPFWLFRQYNPDMDTNLIRAGQQIIFPVVEAVVQ